MNWLGENLERWNVNWMTLVICWEAEVEVDCFGDMLGGGS